MLHQFCIVFDVICNQCTLFLFTVSTRLTVCIQYCVVKIIYIKDDEMAEIGVCMWGEGMNIEHEVTLDGVI